MCVCVCRMVGGVTSALDASHGLAKSQKLVKIQKQKLFVWKERAIPTKEFQENKRK